jgi:hypothetical protein
MRLRWIPDVAVEWAAFRPCCGGLSVAALQACPEMHESYAVVVENLAQVLTQRNPWDSRPWEFLLTSEEDRSVNHAIGFWRRHGPELGVRDDGREASRVVAGRIRRAASRRIDTAEELIAVLGDSKRVRFRRATLLPRGDRHIPALLEAALDLPGGTGYEFEAALAAEVAIEGCCVMVASETDRHEPCLVVYGDCVSVTAFRSALSQPC